MVARGSLTSSLSHLLQNYLNTPPQDYVINNINRIDRNVSPTIAAHGDDNSPYNGIPESTIGIGDAKTFNIDGSDGVIGDHRVPEIWSWESHVGSLPK